LGQAKLKRQDGFRPELIDEWEAEDCVNFAVALARITNWVLHVDWWSTSLTPRDDIPPEQLTPLRVYVADNKDQIFDLRGTKTIEEFNQRTIIKLARKVARGPGGVATRYYSEARLPSLPLRVHPEEAKIRKAMDEINANPVFLASITSRPSTGIPAHDAARYTFGRCAAFAEALHYQAGLPPVAMLAYKFTPQFEGTRRAENGYFHSIVLHPDGTGEDVWGKAALDEIASRFGVIDFDINKEIHRTVVGNIRQNSADIYEHDFNRAKDLIRKYRHIETEK
jgi:hypothetical protein